MDAAKEMRNKTMEEQREKSEARVKERNGEGRKAKRRKSRRIVNTEKTLQMKRK